MIDLAKLESAALAATPVAWQLVSHKGLAETWIRMTPPIDDVEEYRPLYSSLAANPQTVLALVRIARAAVACVNNTAWAGVCDEDVALETALREAGLI